MQEDSLLSHSFQHVLFVRHFEDGHLTHVRGYVIVDFICISLIFNNWPCWLLPNFSAVWSLTVFEMSIRVEEERGCQVYCGWGRSTHHVVLEPARSSFPIMGTIHLFSEDSRPRCTSVDSGRWNTELIHLPRVLLSVLFWAVQPPKLDGNPWKGGILIFTTRLSGPTKCFPTTKKCTNGLLSIKTAPHATCLRHTQHIF